MFSILRWRAQLVEKHESTWMEAASACDACSRTSAIKLHRELFSHCRRHRLQQGYKGSSSVLQVRLPRTRSSRPPVHSKSEESPVLLNQRAGKLLLTRNCCCARLSADCPANCRQPKNLQEFAAFCVCIRAMDLLGKALRTPTSVD